MGKSENQRVQIRFNSAQRRFEAGSVLTGGVLLSVQKQRQEINLQLKLCGKGMVSFTREVAGSKVKKLYIDSEIYVLKNLTLWPQGHEDSSAAAPLEEGHHEFPFSFQLPPHIPSSFQSSAGNLTYYLSAKVEEGGHTTKAKEFFIVVRPLDLNSAPDVTCAMEKEDETTLCCLCCTSGPISARVYLPRTGFVPGETIPVHATITNNSNRRMVKSYFVFEQTAYCHAMGKSEMVFKTLDTGTQSVEHGGIPPGGTDQWSGELVTVPMAIPTGLQGCRMIDLEHQLVLVVVPSGASFNLKVEVDIVIGTVPLREEGAPVGRMEEVALSEYSSHEV